MLVELLGIMLMLCPVTIMTVTAYERRGFYSGLAGLIYGTIGTMMIVVGMVMAYGID